jgi:hypothetical protein
MPCGGGDIGLNVWVENGDILFYLSRSGTFDENNQFLKLGRVRLTLTPGIVGKNDFRQVLHLDEGCMTVQDAGTKVTLWVDVFRPVVHIDVESNQAVSLKAAYESWRFNDAKLEKNELHATSFWFKDFTIIKWKDAIEPAGQ